MNLRRIRQEIIAFFTSVLIPVGLIAGTILWINGNEIGLLALIAGLISVPLYVWNLKDISRK